MIQPINGRLLVKINESQYKHVKLNSDKQHQLATSVGVVLSVAPDLKHIISNALKFNDGKWLDGLVEPEDLVGKSVRWEKFAEQNSLIDMENPYFERAKDEPEKIKVALIEYKDIIGYDC